MYSPSLVACPPPPGLPGPMSYWPPSLVAGGAGLASVAEGPVSGLLSPSSSRSAAQAISLAGQYAAYNEALKRTSYYLNDLLYPSVIPLPGTLTPQLPTTPPSTSTSPNVGGVPLRRPSSSSGNASSSLVRSKDLKFGIDRILDDAYKSITKCSKHEEGDECDCERQTPSPRAASSSPPAPVASSSPPGCSALAGTPGTGPVLAPLHPPSAGQPSASCTSRLCPCSRPSGAPDSPASHQHHQPHHHHHQHPLYYQHHHGAHHPLTRPSPHHPAYHRLAHFTSSLHSEFPGPYSVLSESGHRTHAHSLHQHPTTSAHAHHAGQGQGTQQQTKRKRSWSRAVFSHLQRKGLEKRFEVQKYVTKPDRKQLAAMLSLTDAQVKVWFQNRRMKWRHAEEAKRKKEEEEKRKSAQNEAGEGPEIAVQQDVLEQSDDAINLSHDGGDGSETLEIASNLGSSDSEDEDEDEHINMDDI